MYNHKTPVTETDIIKDCNCWKNKHENKIKSLDFDYILDNMDTIMNENLCFIKNTIINAFVNKYIVESVFELGCGDGNRSLNSNYEKYTGYDKCKFAIDLANMTFSDDATGAASASKQFIHLTDDTIIEDCDLGISLDIVIQEDIDDYLQKLFTYSKKYVCIFYCNKTKIEYTIPDNFEKIYYIENPYKNDLRVYVSFYERLPEPHCLFNKI